MERQYRFTGVDNPIYLVACQCQPWRDSTKVVRLNGESGLLPTPSIDHLFARGTNGSKVSTAKRAFLDSANGPWHEIVVRFENCPVCVASFRSKLPVATVLT